MRGPVICGVDEPSTSAGAVGLARELADRYELPLVDAHVANLELASACGASFLVVGNHGARAPLLGSISAEVSRRAPCPVIVVPPTEVGA